MSSAAGVCTIRRFRIGSISAVPESHAMIMPRLSRRNVA
jgi:hypothetical protein